MTWLALWKVICGKSPHTWVGTSDSLCKISLTQIPLILAPCLKISLRALRIFFFRASSSTRSLVWRIVMLDGVPMFDTSCFSVKQCGQRHTPRNLIQATNILGFKIRSLDIDGFNQSPTSLGNPWSMCKTGEMLDVWLCQNKRLPDQVYRPPQTCCQGEASKWLALTHACSEYRRHWTIPGQMLYYTRLGNYQVTRYW